MVLTPSLYDEIERRRRERMAPSEAAFAQSPRDIVAALQFASQSLSGLRKEDRSAEDKARALELADLRLQMARDRNEVLDRAREEKTTQQATRDTAAAQARADEAARKKALDEAKAAEEAMKRARSFLPGVVTPAIEAGLTPDVIAQHAGGFEALSPLGEMRDFAVREETQKQLAAREKISNAQRLAQEKLDLAKLLEADRMLAAQKRADAAAAKATTKAEAAATKAGEGKPLREVTIGELSRERQMFDTANRLTDLQKKTNIGQITSRVKRGLASLVEQEDFKAFQAMATLLSRTLAKSVEGGRLTDADARVYDEKLISGDFDDKEFQRVLQELIGAARGGYARKVGALKGSGYRIPEQLAAPSIEGAAPSPETRATRIKAIIAAERAKGTPENKIADILRGL